jgi:hypothetical protein
MLNGLLSDQSLARIRWIAGILCVGLFLCYVILTFRWPVIWDAAVMHYIRFLLSRGLSPYSEITDMNLPGCYLAEGWAMAIFGWGDLSWRMYEFFLLAVTAISGMVIGGSRRWFAGIYATAFFIVMHGSEGPIFAVERDEVMMVLLLAAAAAFFLALRRRRPSLMLLFGLLTGVAMSIKPGALLLDILLLGLGFIVLRRQSESPVRYALWTLAGIGAIALVVLKFFLQYHAFGGFFFIVHSVLPSYAHTSFTGPVYLLRHLVPVALMPLIVLGLAAAFLRKSRAEWEWWALLCIMAVGAFSYFSQGKGAPYHRYMFVVTVLLWIGWELTEAMRREDRRSRIVGVLGVAILFLLVVPYYLRIMSRFAHSGEQPAALAFTLQHDLDQLGGNDLQQQVQCMDLVNGCLNALYRLRLVGNTGSTGDLLVFSPTDSPAVEYYRNWFMDHERVNPANVVVLGNEWYQNHTATFKKLDAWPQYAAYLRSMYVPVVERRFGAESDPAYRIYLRKGSAVLAREETHPLH